MNIQEGLSTTEWLLERAQMEEMTPNEVMMVKRLRDLLFYLNAAMGIAEIRLDAFDQGREDALHES